MKRKTEKEIEVVVKGEPDLTQVPKGIMDAFIDLLAKEILKIKEESGSDGCKLKTDQEK